VGRSGQLPSKPASLCYSGTIHPSSTALAIILPTAWRSRLWAAAVVSHSQKCVEGTGGVEDSDYWKGRKRAQGNRQNIVCRPCLAGMQGAALIGISVIQTLNRRRLPPLPPHSRCLSLILVISLSGWAGVARSPYPDGGLVTKRCFADGGRCALKLAVRSLREVAKAAQRF